MVIIDLAALRKARLFFRKEAGIGFTVTFSERKINKLGRSPIRRYGYIWPISKKDGS